eukprot:Nk52_evm18s221 gene=Nk52_evmTU18s221
MGAGETHRRGRVVLLLFVVLWTTLPPGRVEGAPADMVASFLPFMLPQTSSSTVTSTTRLTSDNGGAKNTFLSPDFAAITGAALQHAGTGGSAEQVQVLLNRVMQLLLNRLRVSGTQPLQVQAIANSAIAAAQIHLKQVHDVVCAPKGYSGVGGSVDALATVCSTFMQALQDIPVCLDNSEACSSFS